MAKIDKSTAPDQAPTQEPAALPFRLLVNPSGVMVAFPLKTAKAEAGEESDQFEHFLYSQRPPGVKPDKWFREPTADEVAAYLSANQK